MLSTCCFWSLQMGKILERGRFAISFPRGGIICEVGTLNQPWWIAGWGEKLGGSWGGAILWWWSGVVITCDVGGIPWEVIICDDFFLITVMTEFVWER